MPLRVLLAARLGEGGEHAAAAAARLADEIGGELVVAYVAMELSTVKELHAATGEDEDELRERIVAEVRDRLEEYLAGFDPVRPVRTLVLEGDVVEALVRAVREERADYLVIGADSRSTLQQLVLGSTAAEILRRSPRPVLVVPPAA
jgi:nucleotide-binding universal stress UspA family protein